MAYQSICCVSAAAVCLFAPIACLSWHWLFVNLPSPAFACNGHGLIAMQRVSGLKAARPLSC